MDKYKYYAKEFEIRFNKKFKGKFRYISGYTGCESKITCECLVCGELLVRSATAVREGHTSIRCENCRNIKRQILQEKHAKHKQDEEFKKQQKKEDGYRSICNECGKEFIGYRKNLKYCSLKCFNKHKNRYHEIKRRNKIIENGNIDYSISLTKLAKRDKYICHICGGLIDMTLDSNDDMYGSIDHVKPISKGGTHTWSNVKLAHRQCNTIKRDKTTYELKGGQVSLYV